MHRLRLLQAIFALRVVGVRVHTHRPWAIKRNNSRNVLKLSRLQLPQKLPHRVAVELENTEGVASGEKLKGLLVAIKI